MQLTKTNADPCNAIRFLWISSKFDTCNVVSVNGTLVEDKMRRIKSECAHFSFSKCHIYTDDDARANFSTNSHETDYSLQIRNTGGPRST